MADFYKKPTMTVNYCDGSTQVIEDPIEIQRLLPTKDQIRIFQEVVKFTDDGKLFKREQYYPSGEKQRCITYYPNSGQIEELHEHSEENGNIVCLKYFNENKGAKQSNLRTERQWDEDDKMHGFERQYYHNGGDDNPMKYETVWAHGKRLKDTFYDIDGDVVAVVHHKDDDSRENIEALISKFIAPFEP